MATDKHTATWDWIKTCPLIKDVFFNFSECNNGDTVLAPVSAGNDSVEEEYIDGSSLRHYDFALIRFASYTNDPNDTTNITKLLDVEALVAWFEAQNEAGSFPVFPENCSVQEVAVLPSNTGYVAAQGEQAAKYMVQIRIEYLQAA